MGNLLYLFQTSTYKKQNSRLTLHDALGTSSPADSSLEPAMLTLILVRARATFVSHFSNTTPSSPHLPPVRNSSEFACCLSFVSPQFAYQILKLANKHGTRNTSKKSEQGTRHKIMNTAEGTRQKLIFSRG